MHAKMSKVPDNKHGIRSTKIIFHFSCWNQSISLNSLSPMPQTIHTHHKQKNNNKISPKTVLLSESKNLHKIVWQKRNSENPFGFFYPHSERTLGDRGTERGPSHPEIRKIVCRTALHKNIPCNISLDAQIRMQSWKKYFQTITRKNNYFFLIKIEFSTDLFVVFLLRGHFPITCTALRRTDVKRQFSLYTGLSRRCDVTRAWDWRRKGCRGDQLGAFCRWGYVFCWRVGGGIFRSLCSNFGLK